MKKKSNEHIINVLDAFRKITRIVLSEKNTNELIAKVCESLYSSREYINVWILLVDEDGNYLNSAQAGLSSEYKMLKSQLEAGKFPPCSIKTLNKKELQQTSNNKNNCEGCALEDGLGKKFGICAPLKFKNQVFGVLSATLREKQNLDKQESQLLNDIASDLGFALHAIKVEEQKQKADADIAEERFLMNTLMDNLHEHVYFKNKKSEFLRVNKSMLKIFNTTRPEQVVGKTDFDFFEEEHARQAYNDEQNIINTLKPILDFEEKETWPDGRVTWVTTSKMPMFDENGKTIGTFGISRDITKQKLTEQSLKNSQEMFRKMGEGNLDSTIIINNKGNVEFWNPASEKMFGYSAEYALGKNVHELIMPDNYSASQKEGWNKFKDTGKGNAIGKVLELSAKKEDGTQFPVEIALSTLKFNGEFWALASIRDITERKQAEQLLRERDQLLLKVTENVPGMIFQMVITPDGIAKFPYCSNGITDMIDLKPADIKENGNKIFDFVHKEDLDQVLKTIRKSATSKTTWKHQFRILDGENNEERWIKGEARPQLLENGTIELYGYVYDVTEQKRTNDTLRLKNEQFELVVEGANDGIWDWNLLTNELYLSPQWKRQLGYAEDEIENNLDDFTQLLHDSDRKRVMVNLRNYLDGKLKTYNIDFRMRHKSGKYLWINAKGEAVRDSNNIPIRMAGSHSDITERILAREKLEAMHHRTRAIMNSVQSGIIMVRKRDRVIVDSNPAVEKILGISPDKYLNHHCNKYICPNPEGNCPVIDFGKSMSNAECIIRNSKNEHIPVIKNVSEIELEGEVYFIESFVDIRKQKETEKQLMAAKEKADAANRAKSEFLANMSHEIRTPMNSILGFSEVLLNKIKEEKYLGYLRTILSSGRTLLSLINDILDLSKIEAGRLEVQKNPVSLHEIVSEVAQLFTQKTQEKNINLIVDIEKGFPQCVELDEVRVRQVLLNILGNAVKFTSQGYVKIQVQILQQNKKEMDLSISISDTGIGISKEYLANIFDSFTQEISDSTRKFEGTGLGLAISKKLCELMNGTIKVDSEIGKGSEFTILLNGVEYSNDSVESSKEFSWDVQNIVFKPAKILVVDDVEFNRDLIQSFTEELQLELIEAEDGKVAVELAIQEKPDLILMDIKMPVMDGYEATNLLRSNLNTSTIPVIALTASTMQTEDHKIEKLFDGYLRKPVQRNPLVLELSKFLEHTIETIEKSGDEQEEKNILENPSEIPNEVKKEFNERFGSKLAEFENAMAIDEFELFTAQLQEFAEENNIRFLSHQVECLQKYIDEFEFNKIISVLHELQKFFRIH